MFAILQGGQASNQVQRCFSTAVSGSRQKTWLQEAKAWSKIAKQLSKARLSALVVSTTAVGFIAGKQPCKLKVSTLFMTNTGAMPAPGCRFLSQEAR